MKTDRWPLGYLYRTRIGSPASAVSFAWLEVAPLGAALALHEAAAAAIFVVAHLGLLALYEIGYRRNDRATTSAEPGGARRASGAGEGGWLAVRLVAFAAVAAAIVALRGPAAGAAFAAAGAGVLALLAAHTAIGERLPRGAPMRWASFAWLAATKYLPALLAVRPADDALALSAVVFAAYGAGRVVEYAIRKHGGAIRAGALDVNACWLIAAAPLLLGASAYLPSSGADIRAVAAVLAAHHAVAATLRARAGRMTQALR